MSGTNKQEEREVCAAGWGLAGEKGDWIDRPHFLAVLLQK